MWSFEVSVRGEVFTIVPGAGSVGFNNGESAKSPLLGHFLSVSSSFFPVLDNLYWDRRTIDYGDNFNFCPRRSASASGSDCVDIASGCEGLGKLHKLIIGHARQFPEVHDAGDALGPVSPHAENVLNEVLLALIHVQQERSRDRIEV